jgi:threonine/homoserine/homoserine lactone efflux protein
MPSTSALAAFAVSAFILVIIPGPSVLFVIGRAISLGRRAAVVSVIGNSAGAFTQVLFVAAGLGALVERSAAVYNTVKLAGAGYLIYLGIRTVVHRRAAADTDTDSQATTIKRPTVLLRDGFVVGVSNPKVIVFFAAILPQFVHRGGAPASVQMIVLGLVFVAIALTSDSMWGLLAGTAREWFRGSPQRLQRLTGAGGLMIAGLGARLALTGRDS